MNRKRFLIGGIIALAVLAGAWIMFGRNGDGDVVYRFATVERGNIQQTVQATGTLSAVKTVQVGTQVSGKVVEEFADFNDQVKKGQLLARIDPTLQEQAVRDAQAQLARSQAQLIQARAEYNRNAELARQKFISASEFGTIEVNLSVAQAGVRSAEVTLDRARQNLAYTNIYAPIDGVVVERNVDVGQTVAASLSAPQLYLIAQDLKQMQILAAVDESDIGSIKQGQAVQFTVQAFPNRNFVGSVDEVRLQSKLQDNVVSYTVVVKVDNSNMQLLPGMTATVSFITGSATNVLTVPNAALRYRPSAEELQAAGLPPTFGQDTTRRRGAGATTGAAGGAAAGGAGGGGAGAGGFGGGQGGTGGARRRAGGVGGPGTLWTLDAKKKLKPIRVRTGLSDGQRTQVTGDSVAVGMQVIIGSSGGPTAAPAAGATSNPLAPQRQGGPGGGGGGRPGGF
ncbi:MAG TPA: efflux RND transporter periplasmic adaptor subunit [Gemmatimonadaceae bacterium]|jgi:HlyD family secretion protein|nr:efflux RND transporter periplasmic adaptor subunit [Gemmatimonadaceae bacterium]